MPGQGDAQIQELIKKLAEIDYNGFLTLEPHLESGGQFGGSSGAGLFKKALEATRNICDEENLKYS
jgi:sugar phosphate isomerase/epimerase